jgi:predicted DNA-binding transcriptional regulator AlpA
VNKQFISQYISDQQLAARYGVSRTTIWRWSNTGNLPKPVQLSPGCTRWRLDQVEQRDAERER